MLHHKIHPVSSAFVFGVLSDYTFQTRVHVGAMVCRCCIEYSQTAFPGKRNVTMECVNFNSCVITEPVS